MSKIVSIATSVPSFRHKQADLFSFADRVYSGDESESRKLKFLYRQSGISTRYSVIPDYSLPDDERIFFPPGPSLEPVPCLEKRMEWFNKFSPGLSVEAIEKCIENIIDKKEITHLITVSCTGMSAPGLDLQVMEIMGLPQHITRTSVNFMGCYAGIHALKMADAFCNGSGMANVIIVCTELCTLHFQKENTTDNMTSSLLFGDGSAAVLLQNDESSKKGLHLDSFFSDVSFRGKQEMAWELSSLGFQMTLTGYVPELIKEDFDGLVTKALGNAGLTKQDITHWCIHPGGKKILEAIAKSMSVEDDVFRYSYEVLFEYGNMSSPSILFVLKKIMQELRENNNTPAMIFCAAFGPGLTTETFIGTYG